MITDSQAIARMKEKFSLFKDQLKWDHICLRAFAEKKKQPKE